MFERTTAGQRRKLSHAVIGGALTFLLALAAKAETTFHADEPGSKVSAAEAAKAMGKGEKIYRCRRVVMGKGINPVAFKGSDNTWHTAVSGALEEGISDRLANGEKTYRCEAVYVDEKSGRVRKAQD